MSGHPRSRAMVRMHDDAGVMAVVVALSVSTFLLAFAALAVDLGIAYARKADLQSAVDKLAVATAQGLPSTTDARTTFTSSFGVLCDREGQDLWDDVCDGTPDVGWATDGDRSNGEVEFLQDPNRSLTFRLPDTPSPPLGEALAVRVLAPPSRVDFGFGGLFGADHADVQKSATARIGTPMGAGILPFALTEQDVTNGQFCVVDPTVPPAATTTVTPPASQPVDAPGLSIVNPNPAEVAWDRNGDGEPVKVTLSIRMRYLNLAIRESALEIRASTSPNALPTRNLQPIILGDGSWISYRVEVDVPRGDPGTVVSLWARGQQRNLFGAWENFTTPAVSLTFLGRPPGDPDPCTLPQAQTRGFVDLARRTSGEELTRNVRTGPEVQLYPTSLVGAVLGAVGDLCVANLFDVATSCLTPITGQAFSDPLKTGLLDGSGTTPGRMIGDCGGGTLSAGGASGVDASRLMHGGSTLVDQSFGSGAVLRQRVVSGTAPPTTRGWITSEALQCKRMAVLPVLGNSPLSPAIALLGGREISGFAYVWIDSPDANRGLSFNNGRLRSVSGYVIDPRYLPPVVAGSGSVGPYLGGDMPKEAMLICDVGGDGARPCDRPE